MAKNSLYDDAQNLKVPVPEGTKSGDPVLVGAAKAPGYALIDADDNDEATVAFGPCGAKFEVEAKNGESNSAVAVGDTIYIDSEGELSKTSSGGTVFGMALGVVKSGEKDVIGVKIAAF